MFCSSSRFMSFILEFPHGCHWGLLEISAFANAFDCTRDIPQQVEELREGLFVTKSSSHCGRPSLAGRHLKWRTTRRLPKWCLVISMKVEISYVFFNVFDSFDGKIQLYNIVTDPFVSCCMEPRCSEHSLVLDGTEFPSETQGLQNPLNLLKYLDWFQKFCTQQPPLIPRTRNVSHNSENFGLWSLELAIFFEWVSHVSQKRPPTIARMLNCKEYLYYDAGKWKDIKVL